MLASEERSTEEKTDERTTPSATVQSWIVDYIAKLLDVDATTVDPTISFDRHGIDSASSVALISDLEEWLKIELEPTLMYDYPTIEALSGYLSIQVGDREL